MSFDAAAHPREGDGKFAEKTGGAPEVTLSATPEPRKRMVFRYPGSDRYDPVFAEAKTFAAVDEAWKRETNGAGYMEKLLITDAAQDRSRVLREEEGAPRTPTELRTDGFFASPFAHAENDVELYHQFSMMTEEPPGDGEASKAQVRNWMNSIYAAHDKRRAELERAGVVSGRDTISAS